MLVLAKGKRMLTFKKQMPIVDELQTKYLQILSKEKKKRHDLVIKRIQTAISGFMFINSKHLIHRCLGFCRANFKFETISCWIW
jgi:hypothetical protein